MNGGCPDSGIDVVFFPLATCSVPWREEGNAPCGRTDATDADALSDGWTDGRQDFPSGSASFLSRRSQWRTECTYATDSPRPVPGLYELGAALPFEKLLGCAKYCAEDVTISRARLRDMLHIEIFKDGKIERRLAPERTYISISTCLRRIKSKQETKSAPR